MASFIQSFHFSFPLWGTRITFPMFFLSCILAIAGPTCEVTRLGEDAIEDGMCGSIELTLPHQNSIQNQWWVWICLDHTAWWVPSRYETRGWALLPCGPSGRRRHLYYRPASTKDCSFWCTAILWPSSISSFWAHWPHWQLLKSHSVQKSVIQGWIQVQWVGSHVYTAIDDTFYFLNQVQGCPRRPGCEDAS